MRRSVASKAGPRDRLGTLDEALGAALELVVVARQHSESGQPEFVNTTSPLHAGRVIG